MAAGGSSRIEDRTLEVGQRLIILGMDGVARTFELMSMDTGKRTTMGMKRPRVAKFVDTGFRPDIGRGDA